MGLFELARRAFPGWISKSPREHWGLWVDAAALLIDAVAELADIGIAAARPGQVDDTIAPNLGGYLSVDALPLIGEDRQVVRGLAETSPAYALRLRRWRDDWRLAGTPFGLLEQVAGVLSAEGQAQPLLRLVTADTWYTLHPDGTKRVQKVSGEGFYLAPNGECGVDATLAHAWDWDSTTLPAPADQGDNTRSWLIIYPPAAGPYLVEDDGTFADPGVIGDAWNNTSVGGYEDSPWSGTIGTNAPISLVENVRGVVQDRRCAGYRVAWIVVCFDETELAPDGSGTAYPDGEWGHHSRFNSGTGVREVARPDFAEFWPAEPGGWSYQ